MSRHHDLRTVKTAARAAVFHTTLGEAVCNRAINQEEVIDQS